MSFYARPNFLKQPQRDCFIILDDKRHRRVSPKAHIFADGPGDYGAAARVKADLPLRYSLARPFAPRSTNKGDPATGFLNLDRDFVLALTDAGLAWGAIDFGAESGEVMHFDCRLDGKGKDAYAGLIAG